MRVIGYIRVSTEEQSDSGAGLEAQRTAIRAEAERKGWTLTAIYEDVASGKTMRGRTGLDEAVSAIESGDAGALIVTKLDRLTRSVADFAAMLERFNSHRWGLVLLDLGIDTTTIMGEAMAHVTATFAQMERRRIGERTKEALAVKKQQGVKLGRPRALSDEVRAYIVKLHAEGLSIRKIAERLNAESVPTAHGGRQWYPNTVARIVRG